MKKTLVIIVMVLVLMASTVVVALAASSTVYLQTSNTTSKYTGSISTVSAQAYGYSYTDSTNGTFMELQCYGYDNKWHYKGGADLIAGGNSRNIPLTRYDDYSHNWRVRLYPWSGKTGAHSFGTVYN